MRLPYRIALSATLFACACGESSAPAGVLRAEPSQLATPPAAASALLTPLPALSSVPRSPESVSVAGAYAMIPHAQTVWSTSRTTIASRDAQYLSLVFAAIDQAIVSRVLTLRRFLDGSRDASAYIAHSKALVAFLRGITPSPPLAAYHAAVTAALESQRALFEAWSTAPQTDPRFTPSAWTQFPAVGAASTALHGAYTELMRLYPNEEATNRQAFFDYHCALDFL